MTPWPILPRPLALGENELHVWRARLDVAPDVLAACDALLGEEDKARAVRFVFAEHRNRYVAAHGLLRTLLANYLDASPAALSFGVGPHGKPFLHAPDGAHRLCFNMAHSGDLALFALAWGRRVGVDVEQVRMTVDFRALATSVFSREERAALATLPDESARSAFFSAWVRKEAYIKALGEGLSHPLDSFTVSLLPEEAPQLHLPNRADAGDWALYALDAGPGYAAAVVCEGAPLLRCCGTEW